MKKIKINLTLIIIALIIGSISIYAIYKGKNLSFQLTEWINMEITN